MWGRFQGPLRFPLDSNRLLSSPLADELLEIETPCTVSWDNNGISEAHLQLRAPLNWGYGVPVHNLLGKDPYQGKYPVPPTHAYTRTA